MMLGGKKLTNCSATWIIVCESQILENLLSCVSPLYDLHLYVGISVQDKLSLV